MSGEQKEQLATVNDSKAAVWRIVVAFFLALLTAVGDILTTMAPSIAEVLAQWVPGSLQHFIQPVLLAIAAWLLKTAKKKHDNAVLDALNRPSPSEEQKIKELYTGEKH